MFQTPVATVSPPVYITFHSQSSSAGCRCGCVLSARRERAICQIVAVDLTVMWGEIPCKGKDFSLLYLPLDVYI